MKAALLASATPAAAWAPPRPNTLTTLFQDHADAMTVDDEAWNRLSELEDSETMSNQPRRRVQVGRMIMGRDENGEDVFDPIYCYTEEDIRENFERHLHPLLGVPVPAHMARMEAKLAEFRAIVAERQRIEDDCGYTGATKKAKATAARVKEIEQEILDFVPATLDEAARKAKWLVEQLRSDRTYLHDRDDVAEVVLASIARAV